jgi:tryptophan synthase alpha subunit
MPNNVSVGVAFSDPVLSGATIDNSVIGATTAAAASFTTVTATGALSGTTVTASAGFIMPSATVAATGSTQANAAAIATGFTLVSAADATKGILLPAAAAGRTCVIKNNAAAVLKIWPSSGDAINAIAADGNYVLASLTSTVLVAYDATTWYSVPLLAS